MRLSVIQPWKDISNPTLNRVVSVDYEAKGKNVSVDIWHENDDLKRNLERLMGAESHLRRFL